MNRRSSELRLALVVVSSLIVTGGTSLSVKAGAQTSPVTLAPVITTVAGNGTAGSNGDGGPATHAGINGPSATAIDAAGNIYIADAYASLVRNVDTNGKISTIVGNGQCDFSGDGRPARSAKVCQPYGVAVDKSGNVYVADTYNNRVRFIDTNGIISTIAGNGTATFSGDGGPSVNAAVNAPSNVTVDGAGNIYIADAGNYRVRKINSSGIISTVAGNGSAGFSGDGGPAVNASFSTPYSVAVDPAGNIYIADVYNTRIRKVNTAGIVSTIAGRSYGFSGDGGPATSAQLSNTYGVAVDASGRVYIADTYNNRVRFINTSGIISTIAGTGVAGFSGDGGAPTAAQLNNPYGVTVDAMGNVYIADINNQRVRKLQQSNLNFGTIPVGQRSATQNLYLTVQSGVSITSIGIPQSEGGAQEYIVGTVSGCSVGVVLSANTVCTVPVTFAPAYPGLRGVPIVITTSVGRFSFGLIGIGLAPQVTISPGIINTVAGNGTGVFGGDGGPAISAGMQYPSGIARDPAGNMYIATYDNRIRLVVPNGTITTVAGNGTICADPTTPCGDGGPATSAQFVTPYNVGVDYAGNFYISDTQGNRVRKVDLNGTITTVAGNGTACTTITPCGDGGPATSANLGQPHGIAFDGSGNLYIADSLVNRIRKISPGGTITTIAGTGTAGFSGDGGAAISANLNSPLGLAIDTANNVFIADSLNQRIRRVDATTGVITTVAGGGTSATIAADGSPAASVALSLPFGVAVDAGGSFYIVDTGTDTIDKVDGATGTIRIIAGISSSPGYSGDGGSATKAQLNQPQGIALDSLGMSYIADTTNNRVRRVTATAAPQSFPDTPIGQISATQSSLISNIGNSGLVITGVTTTADFQVTLLGLCPRSVTLDPGASCDLSTSFQPQQVGPRTGAVTVIDDSLDTPNSVQLIQLSGNGLPPATTTALAISTASTVPFGTPVTLTATVTPNTAAGATATGAISFYDGATLLATVPISPTGAASTTNSTFTAATTHSLTAVYAGDANFGTSTSNLVALTINSIAVALTTSNNPITYGQSVTFTGTVPAGATGTVQFQSDGVNLGGPVAIIGTAATVTITGTALTQGLHVVTAAYSGNGLFSAASSDRLTQLVNPAPLTVTAESITRTYNLPNPALTYTITGFVGSDGESGSVTGAPTVTTNATIASPVGSYPIQIVQGSLASPNYTFEFAPGTLTVTKATPGAGGVAPVSIASSANPSVWGQPVTLTATLPAAATGLVRFMDGATVLGTETIINDVASISTELLSIATHSITVVYAGDTNYNGASSTALSQVVDKALLVVVPSNVQRVYGQPNPVLTSTFSGFVNGDTSAVVTGVPNLTTTATTTSEVGSYAITATAGTLASPNYVFSFITGTLLITPATPGVGPTAPVTIASSSNPAIFGNTVTLTATMPAGATGAVNFLDGTTLLGTEPIVAGVASIPISTLAVGTHSITAIYTGDTNYYGATSVVLSQVVNRISTAVTLTSSLNPAIIGNVVILTATVPAGATGTVNFLDGTTLLGTGTVASGGASLATSTLAVGTHSITAVYSGDTSYSAATSVVLSQVVNKATAVVTVASSSNPANFGSAVTLTATVPAGASGTVNFVDGTTSLGAGTIASGAAGFTTSTLAVGTHPITAIYSGDTNYSEIASDVLSQVVNKVSTVVTLTSSLNPSTFGNSVALTATVPAGATGTVNFLDGPTSLGTVAITTRGPVSLATAALVAGTHLITGVYSGDMNNNGATSPVLSQIVNKSTPGTGGTTPVTVASSLNPASVGSPITLTATVPAQATGTVNFLDGSTSLGTGPTSSGSASITTSALTPGTHLITTVYSGDANYTPATSTALPQVIAGSTSDFILSSTASSQIIPPGASATYTIVVSSAGGAYTNAVTMSASNLPPGATYAFTPAAVTPGAAGADTTFTVRVPQQMTSASPARGLGSMAFALLLIPLALLKGYRGKTYRLLLWLLVACSSLDVLTGCGSGGYFSQPEQTYTITVTGTSGSVAHSTTVRLTVE